MIFLNEIQKIHFVGIHGSGMSALAFIARDLGKEVKGSDKPTEEIYGGKEEIFLRENIEVFSGFHKENLSWNPDLVVIAMSFSKDNLDLQEAREKKIPIILDSEFRGLLMKGKRGIAVSGMHGKTTATALLSHIFTLAKKDPTFLIGTNVIPDLGTNGRAGKGKYVIIEADEYRKSFESLDSKFLDFFPEIVLTTSIEWEHVDMFPDERSCQDAFRKLVQKIPETGYWVACNDWPLIQELVFEFNQKRGRKKSFAVKNFFAIETYGFSDKAKWRPRNIHYEGNLMRFELLRDEERVAEFSLKLSGKHNVLNAIACVIIAFTENIPFSVIQKALASFQGTQRRFEIFQKDGIIFIDDYAHHPSEIQATLLAVRERFSEKKLWCVWEPHMASRANQLKNEFAKSFFACDELLMTNIFTSAREKSDIITSESLFKIMQQSFPRAIFSGDLENTAHYLRDHVHSGDIVVTLGAGEVYKIRDLFMKNLGE